MRTGQTIMRAFWSVCTFLFVLTILASLSPASYSAPGFIIRRTRDETAAKKDEKKEVKKKVVVKSKDVKVKTKNVKVDYHCEKETNYDTLYSYWSPTYERVVDMYFHEAYAVLNEGFFYSEDEDMEYLPGEWFDIVLSLETYAVVNGEDVKIRYSVFDPDNNELMFEKVFRPIYMGKNDMIIFRAIPATYLDQFSKLYVDVTLTIEGNDAYGGFWLQTMPTGNEGPLRVGDVVIADPVAGGEANPRYHLTENTNYKLFVEYEIDYYLGQIANVEWSIYDDYGKDIASGFGSIEPRAGYGYYTTPINIPDTEIEGTVPAYLDVKITAGQFLGRRILELSFTGDPGTSGVTNPVAYSPPAPYDVLFTYADIVSAGEDPSDAMSIDGNIFLMAEYYVQGIANSAEENLLWVLGFNGQAIGSGAEVNSIRTGKQNRAIMLPIDENSDAGNYNLRLDIYIDGIHHASKVLQFDIIEGAGGSGATDFTDHENYYTFDGFTVFLPPEWDVNQTNSGMSWRTDKGLNGTLFGQDAKSEGGLSLDVEDWANQFEDGMAGTKLTRKSYIHQDEEIITTSFLDTSGGGEDIDLYSYFLLDDMGLAPQLWVCVLSASSDEIPLLYETFDTFLEGLFFAN